MAFQVIYSRKINDNVVIVKYSSIRGFALSEVVFVLGIDGCLMKVYMILMKLSGT